MSSERVDAVVIGGGVMGTSIAFNLARRRFGRVTLVEKGAICSGTSAKSSAIVRTHYTTEPTARMALLARGVFERFRDEVGGESGFVRTGMLVVAPAAHREAVARTVAMNREIGIETGFVTREDVKGLHPGLVLPEDAALVFEPRSGHASPHDVASSYAAAFTALGGRLRQQTAVTGIGISAGRVESVATTAGTIATDHVVIAAGPWAAPVGRLAGLDLPVVPDRQSIVTLRPGAPYGPETPVVIDLAAEVYFRPETGGLILLGDTRHGEEAPGDPDRYEDRPEPDYAAELVGRLARRMPAAAEAGIAGGWSGMYEVTPDWNPIMGSSAEVRGLHYCVGFSGHGFKLAPIAGVLMAEQVADGRASTLDLSPYRLERFAEGQALRLGYPQAGVVA